MARWLVVVGLLGGCGAGSGDDDLDADGGDRDGGIENPLCVDQPNAAGCPCDAVEPETCYEGPEYTAGVGICRAGLQTCTLGVWGPCGGQILPRVEVCNVEDDDCDGDVDEDVAPECGTCDRPLDCDCVGEDCEEAFDPSEGENVDREIGKDWMDPCLSIVDGDAGTYTHAFHLSKPANCSQIEFEGETPAGALEIEARFADSEEELASMEWIPIGTSPPEDSPFDPPIEAGLHTWVEVHVRLLGEGTKLCQLGVPAFCGE